MTGFDKLLARMEYDFIQVNVNTPISRVIDTLQRKSEEGWRVVSHASEGEYGWSFVLARKIAEE